MPDNRKGHASGRFLLFAGKRVFCHWLSRASDSWTLQTQLESASLTVGSHSNPTLQNCRNRGHAMEPSSDVPVADQAPTVDVRTAYDQNPAVIYLRLLDAEAEGADWAEVARIVLHIDPAREPERARRAWETLLARSIPPLGTKPFIKPLK
jgi:hypothetical protein